jgi:hypothetical protein
MWASARLRETELSPGSHQAPPADDDVKRQAAVRTWDLLRRLQNDNGSVERNSLEISLFSDQAL